MGPLALAELMAILSRVSAAKDVLVWRTGLPGWQRAGEIGELASCLIGPPPLPTIDALKKSDQKQKWVESGIVKFAKFIRTSLYLAVALFIGTAATITIVRKSNNVESSSVESLSPALQSNFPSLDDRNDKLFNSALAITMRCINGAADMVAYSKEMRNYDYLQFKTVAMRVCVPAYASNMKTAWPTLNQQQLISIYEGLVESTVSNETWTRRVQQASKGYGR